jgi:hypothetical protein
MKYTIKISGYKRHSSNREYDVLNFVHICPNFPGCSHIRHLFIKITVKYLCRVDHRTNRNTDWLFRRPSAAVRRQKKKKKLYPLFSRFIVHLPSSWMNFENANSNRGSQRIHFFYFELNPTVLYNQHKKYANQLNFARKQKKSITIYGIRTIKNTELLR